MAASSRLSTALGDAGRKLPLLPPVQRGVYAVSTRKAAAPRVKVGADVLPWWPVHRRLSDRWKRAPRSGAPPSGHRRRRRSLVGDFAGRRIPALGQCAAGQSDHVLFLDDDPVPSPKRCGPDLGEAVERCRQSSRCSPHRFTSCRPARSGIAMCRDEGVPMRIGLMVGSDKERSRRTAWPGLDRRRRGRRSRRVQLVLVSRRCPATWTQ